jgi:hypothetical protein
MFDVCLDLYVCLLSRVCVCVCVCVCEREREREREGGSSHVNSIHEFLNGFMFMSPRLLEMLE